MRCSNIRAVQCLRGAFPTLLGLLLATVTDGLHDGGHVWAQDIATTRADSGTQRVLCDSAIVVGVESVLVEGAPLPEISSEVTLRCADGTTRSFVRAAGRVGDYEVGWSDDVVVEVGDQVSVGRDSRLRLLGGAEAAAIATSPLSRSGTTCVGGTFTLVEMYRALNNDFSCRISIG